MFRGNICIFYLLHLVIVFCTTPSRQTLSTNSVDEMMQNSKLESKLSRQRRYLIFPTGSSVQLVYGFDVAIPDYTVYVSTGITVALAWNLPDKPIYPELEYDEHIENGSLVDEAMMSHAMDKNDINSNFIGHNVNATVNGDSTNIVSENLNKTRSTIMKLNKNDIVDRITNYAEYYFRNRRPDSYYFGRYNSSFNWNNFAKYIPCKNFECNTNGHLKYYYQLNNDEKDNRKNRDFRPISTIHSKNPSNDAISKIETYFKPWIESSLESSKIPSKSNYSSQAKAKKISKTKPIVERLHIVYPALKNRYIRETATTYEKKFYLDHHRQTRQQLYKIIEKYLFAKGYNGTECVLKTLCEVRKKQNETQPGSFLVEILRAVFSLPVVQLKNVEQKRHIDYDNAHQNASDCTIDYPLCPENIWNARFIIESDATIH